jgi:SAM-dependent methyltransferase
VVNRHFVLIEDDKKESMKTLSGITLRDVQSVYSGPEFQLWELVMGEQIHLGGYASSMALADRAGICAGTSGVDLCCCTGAGMRFLVRCRGVAQMTGVDATPNVVELGRERCRRGSFGDHIRFVNADACRSGLANACADFVWGEDAWCYVADKRQLVAEAVRIVKPSGIIAFTDWVEGPVNLSNEEAARFLAFMKFPSFESREGYASLMRAAGCTVLAAEFTDRFAPCVDLYLDMLSRQFAYDALRILEFNHDVLAALAEEMTFMQRLAHEHKIAQGMFVAKRT